jgi:hypothetical protein
MSLRKRHRLRNIIARATHAPLQNRVGGLSMKIGSPKEQFDGENRVAMTPASAKDLQKLGYDCVIESGAGAAAGFSDKTDYLYKNNLRLFSLE